MMKQNWLPMRLLPLARFSWNQADNTLVAEASSLVRAGENLLQQMYNDACDLGIAIQSLSTQKVYRFFFKERKTQEGDVLYWEFTPEDKNCPINKVTIFND
jgi:hypothetical protein